ncbi:MAG: RNA polymerase-binding protein RbpA [Candidatus Nanopelagicales bacterium]
MTALRGFRLTSHSYESDENVVLMATVPHTFHCPLGHTQTLAFAADAEEIPHLWDCPRCGRVSHLDETAAKRAAHGEGAGLFSPRTAAATKSSWEMLLERRSTAELEALLDERLQMLRSSGH